MPNSGVQTDSLRSPLTPRTLGRLMISKLPDLIVAVCDWFIRFLSKVVFL